MEEMRGLSYNPIWLFKVQGQPQSEETDNMSVADFVLVIQTQFQRDAFQAFGNDVVCVDSTYKTNMYDFNLITFVVLDEYGEGVPVAWAISNREDTLLLTEVLKSIKDATGPLHPQWFMSDDAEQFFNAWKGAFGGDHTRKLLCAWHLD